MKKPNPLLPGEAVLRRVRAYKLKILRNEMRKFKVPLDQQRRVLGVSVPKSKADVAEPSGAYPRELQALVEEARELRRKLFEAAQGFEMALGTLPNEASRIDPHPPWPVTEGWSTSPALPRKGTKFTIAGEYEPRKKYQRKAKYEKEKKLQVFVAGKTYRGKPKLPNHLRLKRPNLLADALPMGRPSYDELSAILDYLRTKVERES